MDGTILAQLVAQLAGAATAATGGGGINWFVMLSTIGNAVLFFGFVGYKLRPIVSRGLSSRRDSMARQLEEARIKQEDAERRLAEYAHRLEHLEEEVERIVRSFEAEAKADAERMKAETERAIERLARENDFTIQQELRKAQKLIQEAGITATLEVAESLVKERITDADRRRLADQYIASLEKSAPAA